MTSLELAKLVYNTFSNHLFKFDSVKDISNDLKDATNTSIKEAWESVKPIFIEEFEKDGELVKKVTDKNHVVETLTKKIEDRKAKNADLSKLEKLAQLESASFNQNFEGATITNQNNISGMKGDININN